MVIIENRTPRRERKKADTRARIIKEAIQLFGERSVDSVTVDEIAKAADVGKGTIYNYFLSKEEIVVAFLAEIEERVHKRVRFYASAPGPLPDLLTSFLSFQLRLKRPYREFVRVFFSHMFAHGNASSPWMRKLQDVINPALEYLFMSLQQRGLVRQDVPIADLVQVFKMLHIGIMTVWVMEGPPWKGTQHLMNQSVRVFCEGIGE